MRWFILLVCCGGCDLVIPLTEPENVACGPYARITPVMFDVGLEEPSDFSIHYNGAQGMVRARVTLPGTPTLTYTGPVPIVFDDPSQTWKLDPTRFGAINAFRLDGGHLLGDGSVFGWKDRIAATGTPPQLDRYTFNPTMMLWSADSTGQMLETDLSRNLRPGNEIVLPLENNGLLRFFVQVRVDYERLARNQIVIRQKFVSQPWLATDQADKIARLATIDPSAAVMTADHGVLVYAASDSGAKQRIYASRRDAEDQFEIGRPIDLDSDPSVDDTEPWIAEDCRTLYFRRGGVTYRAQ